MKSKILFIFLFTFFSITTNAAFDLVLDNSLNDPKAAEVANKVLNEVKEILPEEIKTRLKIKIPVFFDLVSGDKIYPFDCTNDYLDSEDAAKKAVAFWNQLTKSSPEIRFHEIVESKLFPYRGKAEIHINHLFINVLKGQNQNYACEHRNFMNLLKANIIHQVARAYDLYYSFNKKFVHDEGFLNLTDFIYYEKTDDNDAAKKYRTTGSNRRYFPRAEHPYSNVGDAQTHFAYNMEFFLLDPEYKCRKPTLYSYFVEKFNHRPKLNSNCRVYTKTRYARMGVNVVNANYCPLEKIKYTCSELDSKIDPTCKPGLVKLACPIKDRFTFHYDDFEINPARVYGAQYFKAGPGEGMMSRFGHAAFRLMLCRDYPQHGDPSKCVQGQYGRRWANDVVFNYRANTMGLQISNWRGLGRNGGYPTQLFFSNVDDYASEYNNDELRNLYTIPLNLTETKGVDPAKATDPDNYSFSKSKLQMFAFLGLEKYWGYVSNYNFLVRNCAHEAFEHIKAVLNDQSLNSQFSTILGIMTPNMVSENLAKEKKIKDSKAEASIEGKLETWAQYNEKRKEVEARKLDVIDSNIFDVIRSMKFVMEALDVGLDVSTPVKVQDEVKNWVEAYSEIDLTKPNEVHAISFVRVSDKILQDWKARKQKGEKLTEEIEMHLQRMAKLGAQQSDIHQWLTFSHLTWLFRLMELYPNMKSNGGDPTLGEVFGHFYAVYKHVSRQLDMNLNKTTLTKVCNEIDCPGVDGASQAKTSYKKVLETSIALMNPQNVIDIATNDNSLKNKLNELALFYYQTQAAKRPFSFINVKPGYGIPLENEVYMNIDDRRLITLSYLQGFAISEMSRLIYEKDKRTTLVVDKSGKSIAGEDSLKLLFPYAELTRGLRSWIYQSQVDLGLIK